MDKAGKRVLLDCGDLQVGLYKFAVSRMGSNEHVELERIEFYARITETGTIELSVDGDWGRFSSDFSEQFRTEQFYLQFMKGLDSVPSDATVLDVKDALDSNG